MAQLPFVLLFICLVAGFVACGGDDGDSASTPTLSAPGAVTSTESATAPPLPTDSSPDPGTPTAVAIAPGEDPMGDQLLYLALGDSLSEGRGASDEKRTAWVPLVAEGLGAEYELLNLGNAGDDSRELIGDGPLDHALEETASRANDGVPGNEVAVITLEIGGNDLLDLYDSLVLTGECPSVEESLQKQECVDGLQGALDGFGPNLAYTLEALQAAAPGVPIYLMTLYNPFSGGIMALDPIGALTLEGQADTPFPSGLNDIIREVAGAHPGVVLVEWYGPFLQKASAYIAEDLIHPNDTGHRVLADVVLDAIAGG